MPSQNVIGEKNSNGAEIGTAQLSEPKAKKFVFPSQSVIGEKSLATGLQTALPNFHTNSKEAHLPSQTVIGKKTWLPICNGRGATSGTKTFVLPVKSVIGEKTLTSEFPRTVGATALLARHAKQPESLELASRTSGRPFAPASAA